MGWHIPVNPDVLLSAHRIPASVGRSDSEEIVRGKPASTYRLAGGVHAFGGRNSVQNIVFSIADVSGSPTSWVAGRLSDQGEDSKEWEGDSREMPPPGLDTIE
jgi:hypothetical protein